jgi:hypothetical protein
LLQPTGGNVLLVHGFARSLRVTQPARHAVATTSRNFSSHNPIRRGRRLFCQLDQESYFSLRDNCLVVSGAVVFLLEDISLIRIEPRFVWLLLGVGTFVAFILEWRYAHRAANQHL